MKQFIVCILMLVFTEELRQATQYNIFSESATFLIKHYTGGKYLHPQGGESYPSDQTRVLLYSGYHVNTYWVFEHVVDHWGYIRHVSSGKYIHPDGGHLYPSDNTDLVIHSGKHWACLFALDAVKNLIIHKSGKNIHPDGGSVTPDDDTYAVVHSGSHQATQWKFVSVNDPSQEILIYGIPTMAGEWKIINMVRNPIAQHTATLTVMVGRSSTQSTTTSFQYTWEVSAGVQIKAFSSTVSQSFSYMVSKTASSTWYTETTRTRTITVSPGQTVVTWQFFITAEQNLSKSIYQSNMLADTDNEATVPADVQYSA